MTLDPPIYPCPDDQTDLTSRVADMVSKQYESAYAIRAPWRFAARKESTAATEPTAFEVVVACPGAKGGQPHLCTCAGTYAQ
jgi:hypothetical protein